MTENISVLIFKHRNTSGRDSRADSPVYRTCLKTKVRSLTKVILIRRINLFVARMPGLASELFANAEAAFLTVSCVCWVTTCCIILLRMLQSFCVSNT